VFGSSFRLLDLGRLAISETDLRYRDTRTRSAGSWLPAITVRAVQGWSRVEESIGTCRLHEQNLFVVLRSEFTSLRDSGPQV
jgi:hypothetical protein